MLTPLTDDDPRTIGPYRIENRIGRGGMGSVYLGRGPDGKPSAVKVPSSGLAHDSEFRGRFHQEVDAARRVRSNRVAAVLDADTDSERPWMATEYVEGPSLTDAIRNPKQGRLEGAMLASLATGLAEALAAIHSAGVVHRDLKPSNILLAWDGPKVIDFGIARAMDAARHTQTGMIVGTMVWMAPEQLRGERAGTPADVFAWGACIAFAGMGRPPFRGERPEAVALQIIQSEPELEGLPAQLAPLVREALAKDPAARPTAAELLSRLAAASADTAVTARLAGVLAPNAETGLERFGRAGTERTRLGWPGPRPPDGHDPPRPGAPHAGGGGGGNRLPVIVAVALLLVVVGAAIVAAAVASGDDGSPPANVAPSTSPTATVEVPDQQTPAPQPPPPDTPRQSGPAETAAPTPDASPTVTPPPTNPSPSSSPTAPPTTSPPTEEPTTTPSDSDPDPEETETVPAPPPDPPEDEGT